MSSDIQKKHEEILAAFTQEFRQFNGLAASFFRAAAARSGMTITDMQVIDILDGTGPLTAGQLADLTGLTTGAITGMLNRLEEAGLLRRERDETDGRRVIVRLVKGKDHTDEISPIFTTLGQAWHELASHYDDEQLAFLLTFLKRSNAISRGEIARLRDAPSSEQGGFSAPLGDLKSARLIVSSPITGLTLRTDATMTTLYKARFEGPIPDVKAKDGVITIRYPRRLWMLGGKQCAAEVTLSTAIPWQIAIQGGASDVVANLAGLDLAGIEIKGGLSSVHLQLPVPSSVVPIHISGGASGLTIRRPVGVAARVHLKGWAAEFAFDNQTFSAVGNDVWLQSPDYKATAPGYDIEVASSASMVIITTD